MKQEIVSVYTDASIVDGVAAWAAIVRRDADVQQFSGLVPRSMSDSSGHAELYGLFMGFRKALAYKVEYVDCYLDCFQVVQGLWPWSKKKLDPRSASLIGQIRKEAKEAGVVVRTFFVRGHTRAVGLHPVLQSACDSIARDHARSNPDAAQGDNEDDREARRDPRP